MAQAPLPTLAGGAGPNSRRAAALPGLTSDAARRRSAVGARREGSAARRAAWRESASRVLRRDEHPRPWRGDLLEVGCGGVALGRPERGLQGPLVGEVQVGDPVVGLLAAVGGGQDR